MRIFLAIGLVFTLSACSGGGAGSASSLGNLNPFNWFGARGVSASDGAAPSLAPRRGYVQITDTRPLIDRVTALSADRTASGIILYATGLAPGNGYHSGDLVAVVSSKSNELVFEFRARPPANVTRIGPENLRELVAGLHLTRAQLVGIRIIRVVAGRNSRSIRP